MQTALPGIYVTAEANLSCKTSEGMEFSHMVCDKGHVWRTLLLFGEILAGKGAAAKVSSAGMTPHARHQSPGKKAINVTCYNDMEIT